MDTKAFRGNLKLPKDEYGWLTPIRPAYVANRKSTYWQLRCRCGAITYQPLGSISSGSIVSCGCKNKVAPRKTHGLSNHRAYKVYSSMRARCSKKNHPSYHRYGGRGIYVDSRWSTFESFWADMGSTWKPGLTIERVNNNGPYSRENCKWVTYEENQQNLEKSRRYTIDGVTMTAGAWAKRFGIARPVVYRRLDAGLPIERALKKEHIPSPLTRWIVAFGKKQSITKWSTETGLARKTIRKRLAQGLQPEEILRKKRK